MKRKKSPDKIIYREERVKKTIIISPNPPNINKEKDKGEQAGKFLQMGGKIVDFLSKIPKLPDSFLEHG
jgi:hypothetical protein